MPVSSYSYFHALSQVYYEEHNPELLNRLNRSQQRRFLELKRLTNKLFQPYILFAFIIHDPIKHKEFADNLNKEFFKLHNKTGKKLLFFALTHPPEQWKDEEVQPEYFKHLQQVFDENGGYSVQIKENLFDDSFNVQAMAKSLSIPCEQLPAIVITTHPSLSSFQWYRTCTKHFGKQLKELAIVANELDQNKKDTSLSEFQNQMFKLVREEYNDELNLCDGKGSELLEESLATALSELLSFLINSKLPYSEFNEMAMAQIDIAMTRLTDAIKATKSHLLEGNEEFEETLDSLCEKIGTFITLIHSSKHRSRELGMSGFEEDSNQLYIIGNSVRDFLNSYQNKFPELDFTPAAICLAKSFEMEINKSIVHWIRKKYNITLPDFYCEVQPDVDARITPNMENGQPIDFNKSRKNGTWHAPAMGQSYLVASKNMEKNEWNPFWESAERKLLLREWQKIADIRNHAAHSERVSPDNLDQLMNSFEVLDSNKILLKLATMRNSYRPSPEVPLEYRSN